MRGKGFLYEVAEKLCTSYGSEVSDLQLLFPNRRSILFFRRELSAYVGRPMWAPSMYSLTDFLFTETKYSPADSLHLLVQLYKIYEHLTQKSTTHVLSFEHFFSWGEVILRDFDAIDKSLVDAEKLFLHIKDLKDIDQRFDFMSAEHKALVERFWKHCIEHQRSFRHTDDHVLFLSLWKLLPKLYTGLHAYLIEYQIAYEGYILAFVAKDCEAFSFLSRKKLVFIGFHALVPAEQKLIKYCIEHFGAQVYWDLDAYYASSPDHEAGRFFRAYQKDMTLSSTIPSSLPAHFSQKKSIYTQSCAHPIAQAQAAAACLVHYVCAHPETPLERIAIVLPEEDRLLPLLQALPDHISQQGINITMGYSLAHTPLRDLTHYALTLFHSPLEERTLLTRCLPLLHHPYVCALLEDHVLPSSEMSHLPYARLSEEVLHTLPSFLQSFIGTCSTQHSFFAEFTKLLQALEAANIARQHFYQLDKAYFESLYTGLQILKEANIMPYFSQLSLTGKQHLFHSLLRIQRIPFVGEPLKGLQIIGTLETRNIDFDCVIVLDLNEGSWPVASHHMLSCVPQFLRQAYGLSTYTHSDALYAYTFYRLLQRTKTAYLLYLSALDTSQAERKQKSRFLYQLEYDTQPHRLQTLSTPSSLTPMLSNILEIQKTTTCLSKLRKKGKYLLSVSDINTYLHCPLQFYYRKIVHLPISLSSSAQERIDLGRITHTVLQSLYAPLKDRIVSFDTFCNSEKEVARILEEACKSYYKLPRHKKILGKYNMFYKILEKYVQNVVSLDKVRVKQEKKFCIRGLEQEVTRSFTLKDGRTCAIAGKIDRIDELSEEYVINDYKTGKVDTHAKEVNIDTLFRNEKSRNWDAVRQVALYALIYERQKKRTCSAQVLTLPTLNTAPPMRYRFDPDHIEEKLLQLLEEILNIDVPFTTHNATVCEYCPYQTLCASSVF